jgi:hypothetical protein
VKRSLLAAVEVAARGTRPVALGRVAMFANRPRCRRLLFAKLRVAVKVDGEDRGGAADLARHIVNEFYNQRLGLNDISVLSRYPTLLMNRPDRPAEC